MTLIILFHRWAGGLIGLVLAVLGLTGAILVHRDAWVMVPHAGDPLVPATAAIAGTTARLMADPAARPQSLTFASPSFGLDRLAFKGGAGGYADQAGTVVTRWSSQWERPELWLFDLHHHLLSGDVGETIVGIAGVAGMMFVITGVILWWRTRRTFEVRLLPRRLSRPAIIRHHRDIGIIAAPLLLLALATGAMMVFRPLTALILGPSAPALIETTLKPPKAPPAKLGDKLDWAGMIVTARALYPVAEIRSLSLPRGDNGLITLRLKQPQEWLPNGRTTLWFAADDGRLLRARDATRLPATVQVYNMLYPLHAGAVGGLAYRLVTTVSGIVLGLLGTLTVWTFWFRKPKARPARPPARRQPLFPDSGLVPGVGLDGLAQP